ncbi:hypothetical protein ACFS7Z_08730 [Pontibacter toksunensis]|uniref:PD-(D/E)XK nuclease superfamily protein n=1 Tax=Pontibacter toksunensis TaxID=1332631 RepID=A0ABW6BTK2_9BACT
MSLVRKQTVGYKDIFEEAPSTIGAYLTGIPRNLLLKAATFFLGLARSNSKFRNHVDLLSMFFNQENNDFANDLYSRLKDIEQDTGAELIIINNHSSLRLFEYSFDHISENRTQTDSEAEINIFKAYLLFNQHLSDFDSIAGNSTKELTELQFAALCLSQSYVYSDIENYNINEIFIAQLIKAIFLFEFLESRSDTQYLLANFLEHFGCETWKEYLKKILPMMISAINKKNEGSVELTVIEDEEYTRNCLLFEKLIVSEAQIIEDTDFKKLRSAPFYKVNDGVYQIIFDLFVVEKLFKGLYFQLNELNSSLPKSERVKDFRRIYTDDFSEKYILYSILQSIYSKRYKKYNGEDILRLGYNAEPDYYLRNGNSLFLFESKDILVQAEVKVSYDYQQIEAAFKKKLYFDDSNGKVEKKAVLQLVFNIERVLKKSFNFDINYKSSSLKIYPIIILHERQYNLAGLNVIVNQWFQKELLELKRRGVGVQGVKPVTIIDIDTFLLYQDYLKFNKVKLDNLLDLYFEHVQIKKKKKYLNYHHLEEAINNSVIPFSIFLSNYLNGRGIYPTPKMLSEKGFSLFH